jgi:coenzyme F420-reducing hydrogenase delta subunit/NAD-dependent dihydropyrimidine dehydrogenase PreA subunit
LTALEAASQLIAFGYEVLVANPEAKFQTVNSLLPEDREMSGYAHDLAESLGTRGRVSFYPETRVGSVTGFAGDFEVRLQSAQKEWNESLGAIVLAPELVSEGTVSSGPLSPSGQLGTLEQLVEELNSPPGFSRVIPSLTSASYAAFLIGLNGAGALADMAQALRAAVILREKNEAQVYFFTGNVKVAEEGLERLYLECRDAGVVFFKLDEEKLEFLKNGDRVSLQFIDPLLGQPFEFTPDLLVTDSRTLLPAEVRSLAVAARLGMDAAGYLQSGNVHLWPQGLDRTGIFAAGPGKGPLMVSAAIEEGRGAALAVHRFFQGSPLEPLDREVAVDKGLCTLCLTCVRFCPHQAIGWTHRIFIHPLACRRCGICASECPMDAIQIAGYSDPEVEQRLMEISGQWEKGAVGEPRILVFGCQRSAGTAWEEERGAGSRGQSAERGAQGAEGQDTTFRETVEGSAAFIGLPCAGKLDTDVLLKALASGAEGVLVLACPEENCRSNHGNTYARDRLKEARNYLEEAGIDGRRLRFENISSNRVYLLDEVLQDFIKGIKGLEGRAPAEHENNNPQSLRGAK